MGWRRGRGHERAVEQWRRELERLEHPGDLWADGPQQHHVLPAPPPSEPTRRRRTPRGPLLPGLAVVVGVLAFVLLSSPDSTRYWFAELQRRISGEASTSYAFLDTGLAGRPVTWNRCEAIRFRVNPENAPEGWR